MPKFVTVGSLKKIKSWIEKGLNNADIAQITGCSKTTIRSIRNGMYSEYDITGVPDSAYVVGCQKKKPTVKKGAQAKTMRDAQATNEISKDALEGLMNEVGLMSAKLDAQTELLRELVDEVKAISTVNAMQAMGASKPTATDAKAEQKNMPVTCFKWPEILRRVKKYGGDLTPMYLKNTTATWDGLHLTIECKQPEKDYLSRNPNEVDRIMQQAKLVLGTPVEVKW